MAIFAGAVRVGMAIFAGAVRVLRRRRVGNLKITQGGEIWAVRREEGSEREGAGRRMLAAATVAYGYLTPRCRRRTRPRPLSASPSPIDLARRQLPLSLDHLVRRKDF